MKERLYYNLGWDYASFGFSIEDDSPEDMKTGFREGKAHFGHKTKTLTIFDRKWLQLRKNALKRNRQFDDDVTPEYLEKLLTPYCPVSRVELTSGTKTGSDWSVDRIINDASYSRSNLAVLSTHVNQVKGSMSIWEIKHAMLHPELDTRLSPIEWRRLYSLCQPINLHTGVISTDESVLMPIMLSRGENRKDSEILWQESIQYLLLMHTAVRKLGRTGLGKSIEKKIRVLVNNLNRTCSDNSTKKVLHKLLVRLERKLDSVAFYEDLFWDEKTFSLLQTLYDHHTRTTKLWPFMEDFMGAIRPEEFASMQQQMSVHTKGFLSRFG